MVYPIGQGSFSEGMPLGIAGTFHFMFALQAAHNVLMHPFHMATSEFVPLIDTVQRQGNQQDSEATVLYKMIA